MLRDLFAPASRELLDKYRKVNRAWLPVLYLRQVLGGLVQRLTPG